MSLFKIFFHYGLSFANFPGWCFQGMYSSQNRGWQWRGISCTCPKKPICGRHYFRIPFSIPKYWYFLVLVFSSFLKSLILVMPFLTRFILRRIISLDLWGCFSINYWAPFSNIIFNSPIISLFYLQKYKKLSNMGIIFLYQWMRGPSWWTALSVRGKIIILLLGQLFAKSFVPMVVGTTITAA